MNLITKVTYKSECPVCGEKIVAHSTSAIERFKEDHNRCEPRLWNLINETEGVFTSDCLVYNGRAVNSGAAQEQLQTYFGISHKLAAHILNEMEEKGYAICRLAFGHL